MHHPLFAFGAKVYPDNCFQTLPLHRRETVFRERCMRNKRFLSTNWIVRLLFDESEQLERFEARDSG